MNARRALFVCIHNSGRSQIAEAWLNHLGGGEIVAESAGFEPGVMNPLVVKVLEEEGLDLSGATNDSVFSFFKEGKRFNYIATVCDEGSAERCPIFPGVTQRIHWSFEDPAGLEGSEEEKLARIRQISADVKKHIEEFIALIKSGELDANAPKEWQLGL